MNRREFTSAASGYLRVPISRIEKIISSAPYRYKQYSIPKRSGGRRQIFHPSASLKALQRWMVAVPLAGLPVHDSVFSYRDGRSIGMNAREHLTSNYFIRFDFKEFFPSITSAVLRRFLLEASSAGTIDLDSDVVSAATRVACCLLHNGSLGLSIGAPSSPHISNAILYAFDSSVERLSRLNNVIYSRYADDVYVSSRNLKSLESFEPLFRRAVADHLPFLRINEDKVQHLSRRGRVTITGVNITPERELSVGRARKRKIRTQLYLVKMGALDPAQHSALRGDISFVRSIEPDFIARLYRKFGADFVEDFISR